MPDTGRAIMLGIRHRCGQEVQFWIPAELVATIADRLNQATQALGLAEWMEDEGLLEGLDEAPPEILVERLRSELAPRGIGFIDVDRDASVCPSCGALLRWLDILADYAHRSAGGAA
ncbi:MAG TPA: hypothetical protein VET24_12575 [Actinomycetota bacterium]|nr:hypothetical protein [Actinomycetota bacterium]